MFKVDFMSEVHKSRIPVLRGTKILYILPNIQRSITLDFSSCHHFGAYNFLNLFTPTARLTILERVHIGHMSAPIKC